MATSKPHSATAQVGSKVSRVATVVGLAVVVTLAYGILQGRSIRIERISVGCRGLPEAAWGLTVLQISDLHADAGLKMAGTAAGLIEPLFARVMVVTGDFAPRTGSAQAAVSAARLLAAAPKRSMPVYAVAGETDSPEVMAGIAGAGMNVLDNRAVQIVAGLWLVGWNPYLTGHPALRDILQTLPAGAEFVLAAHSPEVMLEDGSSRAKLVLTGHTHGGQIRLPFVRPSMLLTRLGPAYFAGLYKYGETYLYINRGLGTTTVPFRLYSSPEITLFTLWARQ